MKLTRSTTPKPFKAIKPAAPAKPAQPAQPEDVDFQDVVRMLTAVTQQNKDFAEGLSILTQKVDQIVKSIAEVMKTNKEFCESVIQEISAISEYINIPSEGEEAEEAEEDKSEEAEAAEEEGITAEDIMGMKKSEIVALIEDNDLPINPADYPKVADLRKALIQYLEEEFDADNGPTEDSADEEGGNEGETEGQDDDIEADGDDIEGDEEASGDTDDDDDDW